MIQRQLLGLSVLLTSYKNPKTARASPAPEATAAEIFGYCSLKWTKWISRGNLAYEIEKI
jgi:hypothetical protein